MLKTEVVRAKCTIDERRALELIAAHDRRKMSETLREIIRITTQQRGLWPPERAEGRE